MTRPRWDCRNESERKAFEVWTNKNLVREDLRNMQEDLRNIFGSASDEPPFDLSMNAAEFAAWEAAVTAACDAASLPARVRYAISRAIAAKDDATVKRLVKKYPPWVAEEAALLALRALRAKPPRGRPQEPLRRLKKEEAALDYEAIRDLWKREYGWRNRSIKPTAIEIAARRNGLTPSQLENYLKRRRRPWSW